jgi:hypothetical protein
MTEFLREATVAEPPAASESWQRAVDLVRDEEPDAAQEPRVKPSPDAPLAAPLHPFLWAGYMLIDCGDGRFSAEPPPAAGRPPVPAPPANLQAKP